jgi:hydrogenase maturation protease
VIGIGNPDRADDAIGPIAADGLANSSSIHVIACPDDVLALLEVWKDSDAVVLIDATESTGFPGRIHRFDLSEEGLPREFPSSSTHGFGLPEVIYLGRALTMLPPRIVLFAVEGACFKTGAAMSPEVAAVVHTLRLHVRMEIERLSG